jgi:hypothetical protein
MMKTLLRAALAAAALAAPAAAQSCAFSSFGRPCGGDLSGALVQTPRGPALELSITGAEPNALAVLVVGQPAATPHPLPGSPCLLLLDPRHTLIGNTDRRGRAQFRMALPPVSPLDLGFQAAIAELTRNGRVVESTDGVRAQCR